MRYVITIALLGNTLLLSACAYHGFSEIFEYAFWQNLVTLKEEAISQSYWMVKPVDLPTEPQNKIQAAQERNWQGEKDSSRVLFMVNQMVAQVELKRWNEFIVALRGSENISDPLALNKLINQMPKVPKPLKKLYRAVRFDCETDLLEREPSAISEGVQNCKTSLRKFEQALTSLLQS